MYWTLRNLLAFGFDGEMFPVHPREREVLGVRAYPDVASLPAVPDLAAVGIGAEAAVGVVRQLRDMGCPVIMVMSDGFAETGTTQGAALERDLAAAAAGSVLIGPNGVGAADFTGRAVSFAGPIPFDLTPGPISVVSHSGGVLASILSGFSIEGVGVDVTISVGNGAAFDFCDALNACAVRATTSTVAAYVEGLGDDAGKLAAALDDLAAAGKRLIVVKPGNSEVARRLVESHTAKVAGPHAVVRSLLRGHSAIVVEDLETLVRASSLSTILEPGTAGRVAVLGSSGGAASLTSDLAHRHRMPLAQYGRDTEKAIAEIIPRSGTVGNPVDLSGGNVDYAAVFSVVAEDNDVGVMLLSMPAPFPDDSPERAAHRNYMEKAAEVSDRTGVPLVIASVSPQAVPQWTRVLCDRHDRTRVVLGMAVTVAALAALLRRERVTIVDPSRRDEGTSGSSSALSEAAGRQQLAALGFPVVPGRECSTLAEVARVASTVGFPLVAKAILSGVAHKAAIGGVELGVCDVDAAVAACERIAMRCVAAGAQPDGFLLEEMVAGTELLVGLTRDPVYGPSLTIGLGGVLSESGLGQATGVLPLQNDAALFELLDEAGIVEVVARSAPPLDRLVRPVQRLADAFVSGPLSAYATVEINPLFLTSDGRVLAGDVLVQPFSILR